MNNKNTTIEGYF